MMIYVIHMIKLDEATIVKDYLAGVGVAELARRCEVSDWTIKNRLQKHNIKTRSWFDLKDQFDEDFFFRDSQEFYYMMGFALGDGALVFGRSQCCLTFTLKYIDRCILENFCKWTNMNQTKIKTYRNGYTVRLVFNRPWMKNFSHLGLVSRKTYHPVIPTIPHDYIAPFILGLIDADGSVSWMKPMTNNKFPHRKIQNEHTLSLVGHPLIVDWVVSQLRALEF